MHSPVFLSRRKEHLDLVWRVKLVYGGISAVNTGVTAVLCIMRAPQLTNYYIGHGCPSSLVMLDLMSRLLLRVAEEVDDGLVILRNTSYHTNDCGVARRYAYDLKELAFHAIVPALPSQILSYREDVPDGSRNHPSCLFRLNNTEGVNHGNSVSTRLLLT